MHTNNDLVLALDRLDECDFGPSDNAPFQRAHARGLMRAYHDRYKGDDWNVLAIEEEFRLPIVNPRAKRSSTSRTFDYAGKVDRLAFRPEQPEQLYLFDVKTTSQDISTPDASYFKELMLLSQASHYLLALWQLGRKVHGVAWDVIRKLAIRPSKLTKADIKGITEDGWYHGIQVNDDTRLKVSLGEVTTETPDLFEIRCYVTAHEQESKYFARQSVPRSDKELVEYAEELWNTAISIGRSSREGVWLKTGATHSCFSYGRSCEYLDLCTGFGHIEDGRWLKGEAHAELSSALEEANGRLVVTNSSLTCYRQCERKYHYRYDQGIRLSSESSDALTFGSAIHEAMEVYWSSKVVSESLTEGVSC